MKLKDIDGMRGTLTVREATELLYPGIEYDSALPQPWVNDCRDNWNFDVRGKVVWAYPLEYSAFGTPFPLTTSAANFLRRQGFQGWSKHVE